MDNLLMLSIVFMFVWIPAIGARSSLPSRGLRTSQILLAFGTALYMFIILYIVPRFV